MRDLNQVVLVGNLVSEPKTGEHEKYGKWALFTIATTDKVDDKEYTQFINCSASKFVAEKAEKITKGSRVMAVGKMKNSKKDDKDNWKVDVKELAVISLKKVEAEPSFDNGPIDISDITF